MYRLPVRRNKQVEGLARLTEGRVLLIFDAAAGKGYQRSTKLVPAPRRPLQVLPYRDSGTARELFLKRRALSDEGITRENRWKKTSARRLPAIVPDARVRARVGGTRSSSDADAEGFRRKRRVRTDFGRPPGSTWSRWS